MMLAWSPCSLIFRLASTRCQANIYGPQGAQHGCPDATNRPIPPRTAHQTLHPLSPADPARAIRVPAAVWDSREKESGKGCSEQTLSAVLRGYPVGSSGCMVKWS